MIRIVTDSAADLTAEELSVPGIFVVPLSVTFADGTTQLDDGTMTKDEFFVRLAEDSKLPRTSQPSPASFMQVYEDAAAAGDEVLVITIGQKLSGTYQCAHLAAADVGLQVHIVDSEAASQAEALLVREAVRLRDEEGLTAEEIAARVKGVENFMLDNCAKIIMAEERGHKTGSEKAGRAVLGENKGKKPGFYGHVTGYYTHSPDISKAGKIARSVLTRSIRHHPDFAKAEELVAGRLSAHARNLQLNFNRQLTDRGQTLKAYVNAARYNQGNAGFNAAVRKMHEYKRYG